MTGATTPAPVLVVNAGSSSLKYQLVDTTTESALAKGSIERIGERSSEARQYSGRSVPEDSEPPASFDDEETP